MRPRSAKSVLIVKLQALGDVLRTTSLLEPLRRAGADRVWWLTKPDAAPLLRGNRLVDRVLTTRPGATGEAARLERLLAGRFDLVLSLEEDPVAARAARAACRGELVGVTVEGERLGYTPSSAAWYGMSLLRSEREGGRAAADALKAANRKSHAALWLGALGLRAPRGGAAPALRLDARDLAAARRLAARLGLRGRPLAFNFHAGARWPAKQASEEKAARLLAAAWRAFGRPLLVVGGATAEEAARSRRIAAAASALAPGARLAVAPRRPLREFAALLARCAALVTTDSLALHLAAALRLPAVALVGPTSAAELGVTAPGRALTPPGGCACFYAARCSRERHCLDEIPEASVVSALRRALR